MFIVMKLTGFCLTLCHVALASQVDGVQHQLAMEMVAKRWILAF